MQKILGFLKQNKNLFIVALYVLLGLVLYANTFNNQMFWDDDDFIVNNQYVKNFELGKFFSENVIAGSGLVSNYWRPLLLTVFSFEWNLWGENVFGWHLVNTLFHILNALLLSVLIRNLFNKTLIAFLAGLVFLVHPLQTEAVSYVNSLGDSLSVFFILIALNNYLYFRQTGIHSARWWGLLAFGLSLLSKETAIATPLLVALVEFFHDPGFALSRRIKNIFAKAWPFIALGIFYVILRATILNFQNTFNLYNQENIFTESLWIRVITFFRIIKVYFELLFYPHDLHMERSVEVATDFSADVLLGSAILLGIIGVAVWFYKKRPEISFGLLWFLLALSPTSNIAVPINGLLYEHWLYLPLVGLFLAVITVALSFKNHIRDFAIGLTVIYLIFLSVLTTKRNNDWQDPITFYNQTLKYAADSYRVINNLGMAYADSGNHSMAIENYERAIRLEPEVAVAYHNLGNTYAELGQIENAVKNFETAIAKDPDFLFSYYALARLYLGQGDQTQAEAWINKATERSR